MRRTVHSGERGFVLLGVILILAVITAAVTLTLHQSKDALKHAGGMRSSELVSGALVHGLDAALEQLQTTDVAALLTPPMLPTTPPRSAWDIFDVQNSTDGWLNAGRLSYPSTGPYANEVEVKVGLRMGQVTQAPPGENAASGYGYVVEVQLSAEMVGFASSAEERVAVGIQIPQTNSYAK